MSLDAFIKIIYLKCIHENNTWNMSMKKYLICVHENNMWNVFMKKYLISVHENNMRGVYENNISSEK